MYKKLVLAMTSSFLALATAIGEPTAAAEDTIECFMQNQSDSTLPLIDWQNVRTLDALEKCAMIIADQLQDRHLLNRWMAANGFQTIPPIRKPESVMRIITDVDGDGWQISGTQPRDGIRLELKWYQKLYFHSMTLGITLDSQGRPVRADVNFTRK